MDEWVEAVKAVEDRLRALDEVWRDWLVDVERRMARLEARVAEVERAQRGAEEDRRWNNPMSWRTSVEATSTGTQAYIYCPVCQSVNGHVRGCSNQRSGGSSGR